MNNQDYEAFLRKVDEEGVLDDFAEDLHGHDVHDQVDLPDSLSRLETSFILSALIIAHNEAHDSGSFFDCAMYHRLINQFIELDDDLREDFEQAQQQHPMVEMFGGMI